MAFETVLFEKRGKVGLITLNRPQALNALNAQLMSELEPGAGRLRGGRGHRRHGAYRLGERPSPPAPTSRR